MASSSTPAAPKILLAKPASVPAGSSVAKFARSEDESVLLRSRLPPVNLLSDSWDFHTDRILPFLTDNTDFTVIGVIGPPGAGKSTIMNELYGFDGSSPGMLPPFATQSEETRAMARHCTMGIELRISTERLILLDTQPIFSPSVLAEMMRPDGSSAISVLNGESLSADLAHELMGIQLGVFLASICHVLLVISEGVHDINMWHLMLTVDLLKHGIPDPSLLSPNTQSSNLGPDKDNKDNSSENNEEFLADPVFVYTKLQESDLHPRKITKLKAALSQYFSSSSFCRIEHAISSKEESSHNVKNRNNTGLMDQSLFLLPTKVQDDSQRAQYRSYMSMLGQLRDQILSMNSHTFTKSISERDWLKSTARIWDLVKKSPVIAEYSKTLQASGQFRR
ncbi:hypothetical protein H6P81_007310 [Aristolochia fimbriata]|uniref:Protein SMG9-like n=1 Tax=Aristolochia fimbriata TaxID=158543 RepID=A0AAV7F2L9_ARIFI|nr:hypothetical protein H6P81_007310 [Aristolochia fimbriata]